MSDWKIETAQERHHCISLIDNFNRGSKSMSDIYLTPTERWPTQ